MSYRPPATIGARIARLSSFYRFLIRMWLIAANPCDAPERPRTIPSPGRRYSAAEVRRLLAVVPDTTRGRRDRAIILTLVLSGRRRAEVIGLRAGELTLNGETAFYAYRGKGGKRGRRELPRPAYEAISRTLADAGKDLATMNPDESLWQAGVGPAGITSGTLYGRFRRYLAAAGLPPSGLHVLRHTAAKLRREAGESVEAVSAFLDHSSLAVTTVYLRRLDGETDRDLGGGRWRRSGCRKATAVGLVAWHRRPTLSHVSDIAQRALPATGSARFVRPWIAPRWALYTPLAIVEPMRPPRAPGGSSGTSSTSCRLVRHGRLAILYA